MLYEYEGREKKKEKRKKYGKGWFFGGFEYVYLFVNI